MNDSLFDGDGGVGNPGDGGWYTVVLYDHIIILIHHYYILRSNVNWNTAKLQNWQQTRQSEISRNQVTKDTPSCCFALWPAQSLSTSHKSNLKKTALLRQVLRLARLALSLLTDQSQGLHEIHDMSRAYWKNQLKLRLSD